MSTPEKDINSAKVSDRPKNEMFTPTQIISPQTTFQKIFTPILLFVSPFIKDTRYIAASDCSQRFSNIGTSSNGNICLSGAGNDFIFKGKYIDEVIPCLRKSTSQQHVVFSAIEGVDAVLRFLTKKPLPETPKPELFTAIRIGGSYQCLVFLDVNFEKSAQKLAEAKNRSNYVHNRQFS